MWLVSEYLHFCVLLKDWSIAVASFCLCPNALPHSISNSRTIEKPPQLASIKNDEDFQKKKEKNGKPYMNFFVGRRKY